MTYRINRAVVIGSGTMGGGIAAHLANAGIQTVLLDIAPDKLTPEEEAKKLSLESRAVRNRIVQQGWERVVKSSPAALMTKGAASLVSLGNLSDDFAAVSEADWVIEVIVEKLAPKQQLMARIDEIRKPGSVISTNTSGIPVAQIAEGRSEDFRRHFLGTHFFNPPRYMKLLEMIPTPDTDPAVIAAMTRFFSQELGKGVVLAKDTPNFIANRIGSFSGASALQYIVKEGYSIEEVDALTGTLIGRPKTGTFRLADLVGIDIMVNVAHNLYSAVPGDESREYLLAPAPVQGLIERGMLGNKTGSGFYKTIKGEGGKKEFWVLDWESGEHRAPREVNLPIIKLAKKQGELPARLKFLVGQGEDRGGKLIGNMLLPTLAYAARRVPEISDHLYDVDNAMRWGYAQELGPFETWDAIGLQNGVQLMEAHDIQVADWVRTLVERGETSFYRKENGQRLAISPVTLAWEPVPASDFAVNLDDLRKAGAEVARNDSASLLDLGDGVLCFEFHSKMNALDMDITAMGMQAIELLKEDKWVGMVVGNQGQDFCVGANIMMLVMAAQSGQLDQVDKLIRGSHTLMQAMRYSPKPVVTAPFGRVLGGGAEVSIQGSRVCAAAETYMGLVEVGVGLIPGAGGVKEFVRRVISPAMKAPDADPVPYLQRVFEQIGMAKVGMSAFEAREHGFLTDADRIVMNGDDLLGQAKQFVLDLVESGYRAPQAEKVYAAGRDGLAAMQVGVWMMQQGGFISEYDAFIGKKLAYVIAGGDLSSPQWVDEQFILDREREAFLELVQQPKTMERIMHMLQTNKPLRN
ncbi:MAG TPA: 3-hydroxyacyl-CoA dehydrogenase/enoyl-CoA hydratase family protein [Herpetosiphonaceae bacterium]